MRALVLYTYRRQFWPPDAEVRAWLGACRAKWGPGGTVAAPPAAWAAAAAAAEGKDVPDAYAGAAAWWWHDQTWGAHPTYGGAAAWSRRVTREFEGGEGGGQDTNQPQETW